MVRCAGKVRSTGKRCKNAPVTGSRYCRAHGGSKSKSRAVAGIKDGKFTTFLPTRLLDQYQRALGDPDLISLREVLAILDSRLADLFQRIDIGESGKRWSTARTAYKDLRNAMNSEDLNATRLALESLDSALRLGKMDFDIWGEIYDVMEIRRRTAESERRRLIDMRQVITSESAMALVISVARIVRNHVTDPRTLSLITADIAALLRSDMGKNQDNVLPVDIDAGDSTIDVTIP